MAQRRDLVGVVLQSRLRRGRELEQFVAGGGERGERLKHHLVFRGGVDRAKARPHREDLGDGRIGLGHRCFEAGRGACELLGIGEEDRFHQCSASRMAAWVVAAISRSPAT